VQHTAPVRAKLGSRPRLEWARYKYSTSCSLPTNPLSPHVTHTLAHTYQFPCPWALAHWTISWTQRWGPALGWSSACNKERRKEEENWFARIVAEMCRREWYCCGSVCLSVCLSLCYNDLCQVTRFSRENSSFFYTRCL